jgi:tetratricopeptide (TPR) repeat protein
MDPPLGISEVAMKNMTHNVRLSLVFLAGGALAACAPLFADDPPRQPTLGARAVQTHLGVPIGYYDNAVTAINGRHYAVALEYLQAARTREPADVRVLTAFGVVYDKLGRFDLSARYYAQAAAVDPQSKIVAADMDYSRRLQGLVAADVAPSMPLAAAVDRQPKIIAADMDYSRRLPSPVTANIAPTMSAAGTVDPQSKIITEDTDYSRRLRGPVAVDSAPPMFLAASDLAQGAGRLTIAEQRSSIPLENIPAVPTFSASTTLLPLQIAARAEAKVLVKLRAEAPPPTKAIFLTGHPLMILDASGHSDAGKSVRSYLSGLRWTVAKGEVAKLPAQKQTVILYRESLATVAKALARTLALPARLMTSQKTEGLQLVVGSDLLGAHVHARVPQPPRRQLALAVDIGKRE